MSGVVVIAYEGGNLVTASDSVDDPKGPFAGFFVGVSGDVKVHTIQGQDLTFKNCVAGTIYPIVITRVWSTGSGTGVAAACIGLRQLPWKGQGA